MKKIPSKIIFCIIMLVLVPVFFYTTNDYKKNYTFDTFIAVVVYVYMVFEVVSFFREK